MTAQTWFRCYGEMVDDAKLRLLAFEDRWHYVAILCCKTQGLLDETKPELLDRIVGLKLGLASRELDEVRRRLIEVELIDRDWQPLGWNSRQFVSDTSAERTRKWRERKTSPTPPPKESKTKTETDTEGDVTSDVTEPSQTLAGIGTPLGVNSDAFRRWEEYLPLVGKRMNALTRPAAMRHLGAFGDAATQAAVVEQAIREGWKTLHPLRQPQTAVSNGKPFTRKTADQAEAECLARGEDPYALIS
jgi:hypothetical protein